MNSAARCLLGHTGQLDLIVALRATPPANDLAPTPEHARELPRHPLDLVRCGECGLVQLGDVVDRAALFTDYRYATGAVPALLDHFGRLAAEVVHRLGLPAGARAVEIGSNDGTLLAAFAERGVHVLGVDPAVRLAARARANGVPTKVALFDEAVAAEVVAEFGTADVVLANNVLAHVRDLRPVLRGIERLLAPDGYAVIEVAHVRPMIEAGMFEFVYHEHTAYFSLHVLRDAFAEHGLEVADVQTVPTQGGSLRCWIRRVGAPDRFPPSGELASVLRAELAAGVPDGTFLKGFSERVERVSGRLHDVVAGLAGQGRRICGYGASARAVTLLGQAGIGPYLSWIVDDNASKVGLYTPGDAIPVVAPAQLDRLDADYCVLFAWNYADSLRASTRAFTEAGGHLVIPFPELVVS